MRVLEKIIIIANFFEHDYDYDSDYEGRDPCIGAGQMICGLEIRKGKWGVINCIQEVAGRTNLH